MGNRIGHFFLLAFSLLASSCHRESTSFCQKFYYTESPIKSEIGVSDLWKKGYHQEFAFTNTDTAFSCASNCLFINDYTKSIEKIDLATGLAENRFQLDLDFIPIQRETKLKYEKGIMFFDLLSLVVYFFLPWLWEFAPDTYPQRFDLTPER